jgi:eukaryotic-like serine/threonine-protein kinase
VAESAGASMSPVSPGTQVGGFTLVRLLGTGGMGETWEAVRRVGPEFEQRVAIKLAAMEVLADPQGRAMFCREASLAASLRHPNIAAVLDWNEAGGYIVCELVDGVDLREVLRHAPTSRLPPDLIAYLIEQIARALAHAHRRVLHGERSPVIHRDMSPGNVVADYDGNLKIVDFGIAKAVRSAHRSGTVHGKLEYMAPEQARGERVDHRADQYALGVMAYEAASGARPHDGPTDRETLAKLLAGDHVPLSRQCPDLPSGLVDIIERMIAYKQSDRFPDLDAVINALVPLAPPPNTHRRMAALVHRARPEETILCDAEGFVSRKIDLPPTWASIPAPGPGGGGPASSAAAPKFSVAANVTQGFVYVAPPSALAPAPAKRRAKRMAMAGGAALMLLGLGGLAASAPAERSQISAATAGALVGLADSQRDALDPLPPLASPVGAAPAPAAMAAPEARAADAAHADAERDDGWGEDSTSSRAARDAGVTHVPANAAQASEKNALAPAARLIDSRQPARAQTRLATLRVKIFPWGRVWVDGAVVGAVPPILALRLPPGRHTVAVGREAPADSREISLVPGETRAVSFDLKWW